MAVGCGLHIPFSQVSLGIGFGALLLLESASESILLRVRSPITQVLASFELSRHFPYILKLII